jgi:hypothetical protein
MRKRNPFLALAAILITLASCQKEKSVDTLGSNGSNNGGSTSGNTEVGTWKFISMHATTSSTVVASDGADTEKAVTLSDYTTEQNDGIVKFDGSKMTATGLTYSVNTIAKAYFYLNGTLEDSIEAPFAFTLPPYSSTATYKKVGTDSLYFDSGTGSFGGASTQSVAAGYKLKFDGDKMTMTTKADEVKTELNPLGFMQTTTNHVVAVTTLQKQ